MENRGIAVYQKGAVQFLLLAIFLHCGRMRKESEGEK